MLDKTLAQEVAMAAKDWAMEKAQPIIPSGFSRSLVWLPKTDRF